MERRIFAHADCVANADFTAVSIDADHGYVFVQDRDGVVIEELFPDMANDDQFRCPGTPAIAGILQISGALAMYALDGLLTERTRKWNYRRISLSGLNLRWQQLDLSSRRFMGQPSAIL